MPEHYDQSTQHAAPTGLRISVGAAAAYTGLAESTLNKLRMTGGGPRFLKISARRVAYDTRDLEDWLATKRRSSTSDTGSAENFTNAAVPLKSIPASETDRKLRTANAERR